MEAATALYRPTAQGMADPVAVDPLLVALEDLVSQDKAMRGEADHQILVAQRKAAAVELEQQVETELRMSQAAQAGSVLLRISPALRICMAAAVAEEGRGMVFSPLMPPQ